ncbi:MAG TPA: VanZ family protein [Bacteroidia bacterium]|nr:VanZ family protein [Bacteroidia bacterium]HNT79089.1 VanZ family protein [Bacteroidia bacterium]
MRFSFRVLSVLWALIILVLSLIGGISLPDYSLFSLFTFDKLVHVFMYGVLTYLFISAGNQQYSVLNLRYKLPILAATVAWVYGSIIELIQAYLIPNRFGDIYDTIANLVGCFFGILAFQILEKFLPFTNNTINGSKKIR